MYIYKWCYVQQGIRFPARIETRNAVYLCNSLFTTIHACYGCYTRHVETEKPFARTRGKDKTVEFFR